MHANRQRHLHTHTHTHIHRGKRGGLREFTRLAQCPSRKSTNRPHFVSNTVYGGVQKSKPAMSQDCPTNLEIASVYLCIWHCSWGEGKGEESVMGASQFQLGLASSAMTPDTEPFSTHTSLDMIICSSNSCSGGQPDCVLA